MDNLGYIANAGQTYIPFKENIHVHTVPYTKLESPKYPELELMPEFSEKGMVLTAQSQHYLPGVTPEMLDWFWANMEKGYYLWAPGSHKSFNWDRESWEEGFLNSAHIISETVGYNSQVFGGSGIEIRRLNLDYFPFTAALSHVICEGVFNDLNEFVDSTIHMWEAVPGGTAHITASVVNTRASEPPAFVKEMIKENPDAVLVPPSSTDHAEYEAAMWPVFLPKLYEIWKNHPDPTQNVRCDLRVVKLENGKWVYAADNGPVSI